jgi:preprotein translocase subunit SecB
MPDTSYRAATGFSPAPPGGEFRIRKIYSKDVSFETPHSPAVFSSEWKPDADVNLRSTVLPLEPGEFEVTLTITVTVTVEDKTAFLVEVQQAGLFSIVGLTREEVDAVVGAYCPSILYPYARETISDLVVRGGFPPFILSPVNFDALYDHQQHGPTTAAAAPSTE